MMKNSNSIGQATVEYLLVISFVILLSFKFIKVFGNFFQGTMGNLANIVTYELTTGICRSECFYGGYKNGYKD